MAAKLLFVDDELELERGLKQIFRKEIKSGEYEIIFVPTGEEALEIIETDRSGKIDLLVTDLRMPAAKIDGWKLIELLKSKKFSLKTVIISAYGDRENLSSAIQQENVVDFLSKPIEKIETFKARIESALNRPERLDPNAQRMRFNTLSKLAKGLPSKYKRNLILTLAEMLEIEEVEELQQKLPQLLVSQRERAGQRRRIRELLIAKQKRGEIKLDVCLESIEYFFIEPKMVKGHGPYYYLRWWSDSRLRSKYLGKEDPRVEG